MAQINLDNYEPVEERLQRFKNDYPEYRMKSVLEHIDGDLGKTRWVVNVTIWKHKDDQEPAANGYAFEIDGAGMTQKAAALETCETSALGRALANLGYVGNRRVTREEMAKVKRAQELEQMHKDTAAQVEATDSIDKLRELWNVADKATQARIMEKKNRLEAEAKAKADGTS